MEIIVIAWLSVAAAWIGSGSDRNYIQQEPLVEAAAEASSDSDVAAVEPATEALEATAEASDVAADADFRPAEEAEAAAEAAMNASYGRRVRIFRNEEWEQIASTSTGSRFYIRPIDLENIGESRVVWVLGDHRLDRSVAFRSSMARNRVNCTSRSVQTLNGTLRDPADRVIENVQGETVARYPEPGTIGDSVVNAVCGH